MSTRRRLTSEQIASGVGLLFGALAFFLTLFDYRFDPTRTAMQPGWFSNFYDLQARAFLEGRLDVPTGILGIEGFVVDGRTYTYFAPLPSVLRIPVLMVTDAFDGRLTLVSMALGWAVFAGFTAALVWAVRRWFRGEAPPTRFEAVIAGVFIAGATGGSTLTYDAALPWVYHEAYLWAAATAVGGLYWLVRTVEEPTIRNGAWLGGFAFAAIMSRIPAGWAVSGAALITCVWLLTPARRRRHGQLWAVFLVAGTVPLAAGIAYNMMRFNHPWLFPLQSQVWTEVNAHRREALAANGGSITGPQFLETSVVNYFRPDGIRFVDRLPWVTLPAEPAKAYGGAFLDQVYRTGSVPAFMPMLFVLSAIAMVALLRWRKNAHLRPLIAVFLGGIAVSAGVMGYGYLSNRYVSDFVPGLVVGGTIGLWALAEWAGRGRLRRISMVALLAVLATAGIWANMAAGLEVARTTERGQRLVDYLEVQRRTSSAQAFSDRVSIGEGLPSGGKTDDIFISGDCDAIYLNTGDLYEPWVLVQRRPEVLILDLPDELTRSSTPIGVVRASSDRVVSLETKPPRSFRISYVDDGITFTGPWVQPYAGEKVRVGVSVDTGSGYAKISSTPGGTVGSVPFVEWDKDWYAHPGTFEWTVPADGELAGGITAAPEAGRALALCQRIVHDLADSG